MVKNKKRIINTTVLVFIIIACAGLLIAAKGIREDLTSQSTIEQVLQRGVLRVGMSTFVPWAMKDKQGNLVGFEIDVAKRLAQDMGVKVEFVPTKWSGILPALLTGKFDIIIGGMGITPERNLKVNFSIPYDYTGMSIVASMKLAKGFKSLSDFNKPGVTIAARIGTTAVDPLTGPMMLLIFQLMRTSPSRSASGLMEMTAINSTGGLSTTSMLWQEMLRVRIFAYSGTIST